MRVLIVSMAAMAETAGSFSRMVLLAKALKEANIDTAVCLAKDVNYRPIDGVKSYFLSTPMPLGLPKMMAKHTFPIAQKIGITSRKSVNSFDDVLHLTGNTDYRYLKKIFITASIPTQYGYANTPRYAGGVNKLLEEYGMAPVKSCLELFSWADKKFVSRRKW